MKTRNPYAAALQNKIFHGKVIPNRKKSYSRKKKHKNLSEPS